jgi:hypothetical protein
MRVLAAGFVVPVICHAIGGSVAYAVLDDAPERPWTRKRSECRPPLFPK